MFHYNVVLISAVKQNESAICLHMSLPSSCISFGLYIFTFINFINVSLCIESIGEGNGTPIQYSCLENPMDGGAL